jgi:hypothetical protein
MAETHTYTIRFTDEEFADVSRISMEQGVPIARVIRLALLYLYGHLGDMQAFEHVTDVSSLLRGKVLEEITKRNIIAS